MNNQEFTKPSSKISDHTKPSSEWTIPLPSNKNKENKCELVAALRKNIGEEIQKEVK
ncbi:7184_t:CDS:2, partial [Racocetra persica]